MSGLNLEQTKRRSFCHSHRASACWLPHVSTSGQPPGVRHTAGLFGSDAHSCHDYWTKATVCHPQNTRGPCKGTKSLYFLTPFCSHGLLLLSEYYLKARDAKLALSRGTLSDHLATVAAFNGFIHRHDKGNARYPLNLVARICFSRSLQCYSRRRSV